MQSLHHSNFACFFIATTPTQPQLNSIPGILFVKIPGIGIGIGTIPIPIWVSVSIWMSGKSYHEKSTVKRVNEKKEIKCRI